MAAPKITIEERIRSANLSTFDNAEFNIEDTLKIWFSKPGRPCLGQLNEWRLISHRARFPDAKITLVSNLQSLDMPECAYLKEFCEKWRINLRDLETIKVEIRNDETLTDQKAQLELLEIAKLEITSDFGCLAAASDIVRMLSPVIKIAPYSDFDISICKKDTDALTATSIFGVCVIGSILFANNRLDTQLNNHLLAFDETISEFSKNFRNEILKRYHNPKQAILALQKEKIFNIKEYNEARTLFGQDSNKALPAILKFRKAMQAKFKKENYEKALKQLVLFVSGPSCLIDTMEAFIKDTVFPIAEHLCKAQKITIHDDVGRSKALNMLLGELTGFTGIGLKGGLKAECDQSWLPSEDDTKNKLSNMHKAATTIQAAFKGYIARKVYRNSVKNRHVSAAETTSIAARPAASASSASASATTHGVEHKASGQSSSALSAASSSSAKKKKKKK